MNLLFPQKEMLVLLIINGRMSMAGILRKKIISITGRCLICFTITAINARQIETITIKNIPAL